MDWEGHTYKVYGEWVLDDFLHASVLTWVAN